MRAVVATELRKLVALRRLQVLAVLVLLLPLGAEGVLQLQQGLPTDTLYGRWVQDVGLAFPLVLLGSVGTWAVPVLASLVAGDVLSSEDAHGTWATVLTRSRTRWQLFWGKAVVAALATVLLVLALAVSSLAAGVLVVGRQDLVGLTGQPVGFGAGVGLVLLAWAGTLPVALALGAGALLVSALTRSSLLGVGVPVVVGGALGLLGLLAPLGALRPFLLTPTLTAWHGLLLEDPDRGPLLLGDAVALGYAAVLVALAVAVLRRRDWAVP